MVSDVQVNCLRALTADARVAGAISIVLFGAKRGSQLFRRNSHSLGRLLRWEGSCLAWNNDSIANVPLDQPMLVTVTCDTRIDAALAQIEVTVLANSTVVVLVRHRLATVVAVNRIRS